MVASITLLIARSPRKHIAIPTQWTTSISWLQMEGLWNVGLLWKCVLQIGDYSFKSHMFYIEMGGYDIVLGLNGYAR